ncbi:hypothetical protein [Albirhodobacter sp. R86504]|uniref:hypothetical protein n=1 Tax=Albirhodobacter sp. R86504 TaxID=3093848 RepID=UPI00366DAB61
MKIRTIIHLAIGVWIIAAILSGPAPHAFTDASDLLGQISPWAILGVLCAWTFKGWAIGASVLFGLIGFGVIGQIHAGGTSLGDKVTLIACIWVFVRFWIFTKAGGVIPQL